MFKKGKADQLEIAPGKRKACPHDHPESGDRSLPVRSAVLEEVENIRRDSSGFSVRLSSDALQVGAD
jgi:hypothetical protein